MVCAGVGVCGGGIVEGEEMNRQRCEGCRWFLKYTGQSIGQCRRYPPTQIHGSGWLEVDEHDWCGEYADRNATSEEAKRRELVRQFALAIVASDAAGDSMVHRVWQRAAELADYEGQT